MTGHLKYYSPFFYMRSVDIDNEENNFNNKKVLQ